MRTNAIFGRHGRLLARLALCVAVGMALGSGAFAAEVKAGGGAIGPGQGTIGGGTSANRGGAGGVSNPDPGGPAGNFGEPGASTGPAGQASTRPGYLGGRTATTPVEPVEVRVLTRQDLGRCDMTSNRLVSAEQRMAGPNLARIDYGAGVVAPDLRGRDPGAVRSMLAGYQEELAKSRPDPALAGTYLGIAAVDEVTAGKVYEVSEALCVPVSVDMAEAIATVAEAQRQKLSDNRNGPAVTGK